MNNRKLTDDQRALVEAHWHYALRIAQYFAGRFPGFAIDWEGAVAVGICQAALVYEPGRGATFRSAMDPRVKGACLDALRMNRRLGYGRHQSYAGAPAVETIHRAHKVAGRLETLAAELDAGELPVGWEVDSADAVEAILRRLPLRHALALRMYYLGGRLMREVGEALGVSGNRARQIHVESLEILREAM